MDMKLYNTLSNQKEEFSPIDGKNVRMYSCGPTVYDHIHIGNLSAFIYADTLRRTLTSSGYKVNHVMNFTDVDDKTIRKSKEHYPETSPEDALAKLTDKYKKIFLDDMKLIGNDTNNMKFVSAVSSIEGIRSLITDLYNDDFAYIADDGIYFSIEKYKNSGKVYGQLLDIVSSNTSESRINNDEYGKENVKDFALWKTRKDNEPAWNFELEELDLAGRPGWHIECSVMSVNNLGQPFDIHTGGIDLIFPHHENEIAQSTAGKGSLYAKYFVHNEHLLVDGKKMSKSLNNFYTLENLLEKGYDPLSLRMLVLQSHYRKQSNFTWENLESASNRLNNWRRYSDRLWQIDMLESSKDDISATLIETVADDLDTPKTLSLIDNYFDKIEASGEVPSRETMLTVRNILGLDIFSSDISDQQKNMLKKRQIARKNRDWSLSDELRETLRLDGVTVQDTDQGQIWYRSQSS